MAFVSHTLRWPVDKITWDSFRDAKMTTKRVGALRRLLRIALWVLIAWAAYLVFAAAEDSLVAAALIFVGVVLAVTLMLARGRSRLPFWDGSASMAWIYISGAIVVVFAGAMVAAAVQESVEDDEWSSDCHSDLGREGTLAILDDGVLHLVSTDGCNHQAVSLSTSVSLTFQGSVSFAPDGQRGVVAATPSVSPQYDLYIISFAAAQPGTAGDPITVALENIISDPPLALARDDIPSGLRDAPAAELEHWARLSAEGDPTADVEPRWSPQGDQIAFLSARQTNPETDGQRELYVVKPDGSAVRQLTSKSRSPSFGGIGEVVQYSWSPQGTKIAFVREGSTQGRGSLYVVDLSSGETTQVMLRDADADTAPSWSADGQDLVFAARVDGAYDLFRWSLVEARVANLTNAPSDERSPSWSPRGQIVFTSDRADEAGEPQCPALYVLDPETHETRRLLERGTFAGSPVWSPDGSLLAFQSVRRNEWLAPVIGGCISEFDLWVANADGREATKVTGESVIRFSWLEP